MNSNATAGGSRALPSTWVCCVAIAASCYLLKGDLAAVRAWADRQPRLRGALFDIAGALHFAFGGALRSCERCVHRRRTGQRRRELLTDAGADALKFRNRR